MNLYSSINNKDHIIGTDNATLDLVEYGDYECVHCGAAFPIIKKILKKNKGKIKFVFRNFPLSGSHPHARSAAYAAEAAGIQGKFWEMHDLLFKNQFDLHENLILNFASQLDLDIDKFKKDMESEEIVNKVQGDFMGGVKSGVNGTPTFYINGVRFDRSFDEELGKVIDKKLKEVKRNGKKYTVESRHKGS